MTTLRDYQIRLRRDARAAFEAGNRAVLLVSPTGSGKTVLFVDIAERVADQGQRVGILMHRQELIDQTTRALGDYPHAVCRAGTPANPHALLQVCSIQTLVNRLDRYAFDLLIVDEAHHCTAASYRRILDHYAGAAVLGVTATPCRTDGAGLRDAGYTAMVLGPTTAELTTAGYLAPAEIYAPPGADLAGVPKRCGDYARGALAAVVDKPKITGDAVAHYSRICPGAPAIAFCVSVAHAEHVAARFCSAGYRAASIDGRKTDSERRALIGGLASGALQVLCSCDLISEGVDVPVVTAGIMLRPTQSTGLWLQQVGRCLRPAPGKTHAIILDHVGNTAKHGLPTSPREWSLDGIQRGTAAAPEVSVTVCPQCFRPHESAAVCPFCGFLYPPKPRVITEVEGELMRIEAEAVRLDARREVGRADSLEALQRIAAERGYKPGWAYHRWQARLAKRGARV